MEAGASCKASEHVFTCEKETSLCNFDKMHNAASQQGVRNLKGVAALAHSVAYSVLTLLLAFASDGPGCTLQMEEQIMVRAGWHLTECIFYSSSLTKRGRRLSFNQDRQILQ